MTLVWGLTGDGVEVGRERRRERDSKNEEVEEDGAVKGDKQQDTNNS